MDCAHAAAGKAQAKAALPSGFSGGAGKAEQWKGESALGKSGRTTGRREGAGEGCAPSGFSGGAGKAEQRKGRRCAETSERSCALGKGVIRRFQKKS